MPAAIDNAQGLGVDVHLDGVDGKEAVVFDQTGLREGDGEGRRGGGGAFAPVSLLEVVGGADGEQKLHLDCGWWVGTITQTTPTRSRPLT